MYRGRHGVCEIQLLARKRVLADTDKSAGRVEHADDLPGGGNNIRVESETNMNALTRWNPLKGTPEWNPFRELDEMNNRLARFFGGTPVRERGDGREDITVAAWAPLVDIIEDDKEYLIKAELPEVKKDEVKVTVENGVLSITGERKFEKEEKGKKYHRVERAYGSFVRTFALPDDADANTVSAEFKDGVLKVHLAKCESAKPKQIEVKVK